MSTIEINKEDWILVEQFLNKKFGKTPDLQAMLYLIGINEFGHLPPRKTYTKEQKQDLIHVAVCSLLEPYDYFMWEKNDEQGWPHYLAIKSIEFNNLDGQESLLKFAIINYFKNRNDI